MLSGRTHEAISRHTSAPLDRADTERVTCAQTAQATPQSSDFDAISTDRAHVLSRIGDMWAGHEDRKVRRAHRRTTCDRGV